MKNTRPVNRYRKLNAVKNSLSKLEPTFGDEEYRLLLMNCGAEEKDGKYSATTMTDDQIAQATNTMQQKINRLKSPERLYVVANVPVEHEHEADRVARKFERPGTSLHINPALKKQMGKLNAMWIAMHDAGVVKKREESAMVLWLENNVPELTKIQWATHEQLNKGIEMLKQFARQNNVTGVY